jgi:hypothetical protein
MLHLPDLRWGTKSLLCLNCLPIDTGLTIALTDATMHDDTYDRQRREGALRDQAERLRRSEATRSARLREPADHHFAPPVPVASTGRRTLTDQTLRAMPWYNITEYNPHLADAPHLQSQGWCWFERCPNPDTAIQSIDIGSYPTMSGTVMRRPELHQACHTTLYESFIAPRPTEATPSSPQQTTETRTQ